MKLKLDDFLPAHCREKKPKDPEAIEARLKARLTAIAQKNQKN